MNYVSGKKQPHLNLPKNVKAIPMICFESIFNYSHINKICQNDLVIQISKTHGLAIGMVLINI